MDDRQPFDAVLVVGFGGPAGPADVRPFLANVLRGRRVPPHRVEEVAANYMRFGGVSPFTEITRRQAAGLQERLRRAGAAMPVYVGMRNWHPYLIDTLREMSVKGHRRAIGFIAAAHHSYSSCQQYKENVRDARRQIVGEGHADVEVTYVDSWYDHPLFIETIHRHTAAALERLPEELRATARIVFTAHSLPLSLAQQCRYEEQLRETIERVMQRVADRPEERKTDRLEAGPTQIWGAGIPARLGRTDRPEAGPTGTAAGPTQNRTGSDRLEAGPTTREWALVYQSRSGLPSEPWLEPDIRDYLRAERAAGLAAAVVVPVGFICDHIEVLFDLDTQAAALAREIGLVMVRADTAGDDPLFIDMMADVVLAKVNRHRRFPAMPIVSGLGW
ncbi:MAG: ferrochelatase [Planctomycetes bacterium]|nr:ferrochelatase [Planctomycetota bacterium]